MDTKNGSKTLLSDFQNRSVSSAKGLFINNDLYTWAQLSQINQMNFPNWSNIKSKSAKSANISKFSIAFKSHYFLDSTVFEPMVSEEFHVNVTDLLNEDQYWGCYYIFPNMYHDKYAPVEPILRQTDVAGLVNGVLTRDMTALHLTNLKHTPIVGQYVLIKLDLQSKHLTDIDVLENFKYITYLNLDSNYLTNLKVLSHLPYIQYLSVNNNRLGKVLDYNNPQWFLTEVKYSGNNVEIMNDLTAFWSITTLDLSHNNIMEINGLINLRYLRHLDLSFNHIQRLEKLDHLRLIWLDVSYNNISSFEISANSGLWTLLHLEYLNINENSLKTLKLLTGCTRLKELYARNNQVNALMELEVFTRSMKRLLVLDLRGNPVCIKRDYRRVTLATFPQLLELDDTTVDPEEQRNAVMYLNPDVIGVATRRLLRLLYLEQLARAQVPQYTPPADTLDVPLIILVGYEAVNKGLLVRRLAAEYKHCVTEAHLHTTSAQELSQRYIIIGRDHFDNMLIRGQFLTYAEFSGESYGLSREQAYVKDGKVKITSMDLISALMMKLRGRRPYLILVTRSDEKLLARMQAERHFAKYSNWNRDLIDQQFETINAVFISTPIIIKGILNEIIMNIVESSQNLNSDMFLMETNCSLLYNSDMKTSWHPKGLLEDPDDPVNPECLPLQGGVAQTDTSMHLLYKKTSSQEEDNSSYFERCDKKSWKSKKISDAQKSLTIKGSDRFKSVKSVTFSKYVKSSAAGGDDIATEQHAENLPTDHEIHKFTGNAARILHNSWLWRSETIKSEDSQDLWLSYLLDNHLLDPNNYIDSTYSASSITTMKQDECFTDNPFNDNSYVPSSTRNNTALRNNLINLHINNPGLFWSTIVSDNFDEAFSQLSDIVKDIVNSQPQMKPMFDIDFTNMDCYPKVQKKLHTIQTQIASHSLFK